MANLKSNGIKKPEQVDPIKNKKDVKRLVEYLKVTNIRNYTIVVVGINVLLRAGDLLSLKWSDVLEDDQESFKEYFYITEDKTDKSRKVELNDSAIAALGLYKESLNNFNVNNYIFESRKANKDGEKKLDVKALHKIIKDTCTALKIKGNFGTHTLRKTGAYRIYADNIAENPMIISYLQEILNHSSQKTTLRYIGIESEKITNIYKNLKHY